MSVYCSKQEQFRGKHESCENNKMSHVRIAFYTNGKPVRARKASGNYRMRLFRRITCTDRF